jgi:hypothetical protein
VLIAGDAVHGRDVGWVNPLREGADSLTRSLESIDRLESRGPQLVMSGHGPVITAPATAFAAARKRFEKMRADPEAAAWHAAKRILAYALMIGGGIASDALAPYLAASPWVRDLAAAPFGSTATRFAERLLNDLLRSGGVAWRDARLMATAPHTPTDPAWPRSATRPSQWETGRTRGAASRGTTR